MKYSLLLLLLPLLAIGQEFEFQLEPEAFPVEINGWQLFSPWSGGFWMSNPAIADLYGDGDLDYVIGTSIHFKLYENTGTGSTPDFIYSPEIFDSVLTEGWSAPALCDIDADGDYDLFATSDERVWYFENIGSAQLPNFSLVTDSLEQIIWWALNVDLVDIDADGDLDLITGSGIGTLRFYRNIGEPDSFYFYPEEYLFSGITVDDLSDPTFCDIDNDNDYDLFIGEEDGTIWFYQNEGDSVTWNFPVGVPNWMGIDVGDQSSPEFADIDGDGDYDLFVGAEDIGPYFYENTGTPSNPQYEFRTSNYLTLDLTYFQPTPQVVDIDNDQDLDLIVGAEYTLAYFENSGTLEQPSYTLMDPAFQGISLPVIHPYFVDIDNDSDLDLFAGEGVIPGPPSIALYINRGTAEMPDLALYDADFVTNQDFEVNANPGLADIDADGDYDLFIADNDGHFFFYRNDGTPLWPDFTWQSNQWQGIQFYYPNCGWRGFSFADIDGDYDLDLLIENQSRYNLAFYRNTGTPTNAVMELETEEFFEYFPSLAPMPYLVDIDDDSDLDIFCGEYEGGIYFFRNLEINAISLPPLIQHPLHGIELSFGPNPANPVTWITFNLPYPQKATLAVYNLLGQKITTLASGYQMPGTRTYFWNAINTSSGTYFIRLETAPSGSGATIGTRTPTIVSGKVVVLR